MSKDLFKLSSRNEILIKQHFSNFNQILAAAFKDNHVISIVTTEGVAYTGRLPQIDNLAIRLQRQNQNFDLEKHSIVIPTEDIVYLKVNFPRHNMFNSWLHYQKEKKIF